MQSFEEFMSQQTPTKTDVVEIVSEAIENAITQKSQQIIEQTETIKEFQHKKEELNEAVEVAPTGYKIFRDKSENFICDMEISGANPANSRARIIIESKDLTYMFEGTIDAQGKCKIPLKKMNFLSENETGVIKLEVIADDTVFSPWEDNFVAVNSKRVSVKVFESVADDEPKIGVRLKSIR